MKKFYCFLSLFWLSYVPTWAVPIDSSFAQQVAINFYKYVSTDVNVREAVLVKKYEGRIERLNRAIPLIYVFNIENKGFVMLSGDNAAIPVMGYSSEGVFDVNNIPINAAKWYENYRNELRYIVEKDLQPTDEIRAQWLKYERFTGVPALLRGVNPLLTTKWDQSPYYNALCPYDNTAGARTVTGCVATAMAQIMKYWNYPTTGTGFRSYNHSRYGTLSANFGTTTYNWSAMPNVVTSSNSAVATLMYHCGVSVDMNYGVASNGGSGAWVIDAVRSSGARTSEQAFKNNFGYSANLRGVTKSSYTNAQWISLMKTELDARRPIMHAGFGNGGGHAFVCDGYNDNDYFHMNWGWGGSQDNWFWHSQLNPGSLGTGGGSGGYNNNQHIIIGLQPPSGGGGGGGVPSLNIKMFSNITVNPNPITYGQSFTVNANIVNRGTTTFYGDIGAAVFDANNTFVAFVQTLTESNGLPVNNRYTNNLTFANSGLAATPGAYTICLFVRPTGGQWVIVGDEGSNTNCRSVNIAYNNVNNIELYGALRATPSPIVRNQPLTVWFDVANFGTSTFNGKMSVDLHKMNGDHIQEINSISNLTLNVNNHYINGLTFNSNGLDVEPGTYQIAAWMQRTGGSWEMIGSTSAFPNPITVTIVAPSLQPDIYENNNTETNPFNFQSTFSNNQATILTTGSNSHNGNDYDYYKVNLPVGYRYVINARLHDSYNSANGQTYTNDVLFSYKINNGTWSDSYDDVMTSPIIVGNGGSVTFWVSPYFLGQIGTYLLDIRITRTPVSNAEDKFDIPISLYPNPANSWLKVRLEDAQNIDVSRIDIFDMLGRNMSCNIEKNITNEYNIETASLPNGAYHLKVTTPKGILTKKFIISH